VSGRMHQSLRAANSCIWQGALPRFQPCRESLEHKLPITMIVPFSAGGPSDAVARVLAEQIRGSLGQPIIIENVGGAEGTIGTGRAAHARPDGYTIELGGIGTHMLNGAFYSLSYNLLNDFVPIAPLVASPAILFARKTFLLKDLNELIAWLKANPNRASAGFGAATYRLLTMSFQKETATRFTLVPYRGGAPAVQDLVAGQIDLLFATPDTLPLVRAGSIKAYAATSGERRSLCARLVHESVSLNNSWPREPGNLNNSWPRSQPR
jgi:tripartite-type tricarboxylate transporter receptor subunit TctC